jgi:hypothetical protein
MIPFGGFVSTPPRRLLVAHLGALGDVILALPALRALRRAQGTGRTIVFAGAPPRTALVARGVPGIAATVDLTAADAAPLFSGNVPGPRVAQDIAGCDAAVLFVRGAESLAAGLRRAGIAEVHLVPPLVGAARRGGPHATDGLLDGVAALPLGARVPGRARFARAPRLRLPGEDREAAGAALARLGLVEAAAAARLLVLHPGSGGASKCWPAHRFIELARRAEKDLGLAPLLILGAVEVEARPGLVLAIEAARLPALVAPTLAMLAAVLRTARAYVGNDSGPTHLAAAVGAPTLALFGPTDPETWAPRGRRVAVVDAGSAEGLADLAVERVARALADLSTVRARRGDPTRRPAS